jgi:cytochrome c553
MTKIFTRNALASPVLALACMAFCQAAPAPAKAVVCQSCHGAEGVSASPDIPNLAGQKAAYLAAQLRAFRDGSRKNDLMSVIASQLAPEEIQALADFWSTLPAAGTKAATAPATPATVSLMTLPAGFPNGFTEYLRANDDDSKTVSVNYANDVAMAAVRSGKPLPSGSIVIVANYKAQVDGSGKPVAEADGRWRTDKLQSYSGMESRAGWGESIPEMLRNGDWHYGLWTADGQARMGAAQPRCFACHKPRADDSYVFTIGAMRSAAKR